MEKIPFNRDLDLECGDGWKEILKPIFAYIDDYNKTCDDDNHINILQIKSKFGGLRFYTDKKTDKLRELIDKAENEALVTCEICGSKENIGVTLGWITTCCLDCALKMAQKHTTNKLRWRPSHKDGDVKYYIINQDKTIEKIT